MDSQLGDHRCDYTFDAASQTGASCMDQDGRIRVRPHRSGTVAAGIRHRHTSPSPGMMVCGAIKIHVSVTAFCIDGTLNSACNIFGMLRAMVLPFLF
ncbi:hypothetical protein TNCV_974981 [Trichonephila clavipes]|nr:hypothetical protein TNCV_974981 [Trichonephila clavipes]